MNIMNILYPHSKRAKILIIDDEEDICVHLKSILEREGKFEVWDTTNQVEGIALAKSSHPDLILLDLIMPEMDGSQVAESLHDNPSTKDILIVFSSVLAESRFIEQHRGVVGGHPFISKFVPKEELIARLEELLQEHAHLNK